MNFAAPVPVRRWEVLRRGPLPLGVVALVGVVVAVVTPSAVRISAALALVAMVTPVFWRHRTALTGRLHLAVAVGLFSLTDGGLVSSGIEPVWHPLVAILAYPLLGRALLEEVGRYRLVRRSDLVVEAALIGAAAAIVLQAGIDWQTNTLAPPGLISRSGVPALLVGLDVALVIVTAWALRVPSARRGPVGVLAVGVMAMIAGHTASALELAAGSSSGAGATGLLSFALLAIGAAVVLAGFVETPPLTTAEPPLFSRGHAVVVVISLLAAPAVLAFHSLRQISVSATIATGTALSGMMLANYLVELLRERAAVEHRATHDPLTGLPNRLLLLDRLERAIAHAERHQSPVGVLYIDLDRFKDVNDTLGHKAGDELLCITAERLTLSSRNEDTVARLGGDEFAVLLPHLRELDDVRLVAQRALDALIKPAVVGGHRLRNPASIGVAAYPADGSTPHELLSAADAAMYRAKEHDGGALEVFSTHPQEEAAARLESETELYQAIEQDQLVLHFQPIFDATDGRVCGAEALVRWQHPERGLLPPGQFVPVAEKSDLIVLLGTWVINAACRELVRWSELGLGDRFISVNVGARHFSHDIVSTVTAALRSTGVAPSRLVIEITESAAVDDLQLVADRLSELRDLGVQAALDDFGTGYCSLQYLGDLPVATLKIDKSFVQSMTPRSAAIVGATIAMGHSLGMQVVAEGVETLEQRRFLEVNGCDRLQGFHLGRPTTSEDFLGQFFPAVEDRQPSGGVPIRAVG